MMTKVSLSWAEAAKKKSGSSGPSLQTPDSTLKISLVPYPTRTTSLP